LSDNGTITLGKDTIYGIVIVVLACLLVLSIFTQGFGIVKSPVQNITNCTAPNPPPVNKTQPTNQTPTVITLEVPSSINDAPLMGTAGSAITVIEMFDFQCPFCGMVAGSDWVKTPAYLSRYGAIVDTVPKIESEYVQTGKASLRNFPVAFLGDESVYASNAALCAGDQGKYWEMADAIFKAQTPEENNGKYTPDKLKEMAKNITGLDTTKFDACVDGNLKTGMVNTLTNDCSVVASNNQIAFGTDPSKAGLGTPTFYVAVDATKIGKAKVESAANTAGFLWGKSADGKRYVIIASPEYAKLKVLLDALLS